MTHRKQHGNKCIDDELLESTDGFEPVGKKIASKQIKKKTRAKTSGSHICIAKLDSPKETPCIDPQMDDEDDAYVERKTKLPQKTKQDLPITNSPLDEQMEMNIYDMEQKVTLQSKPKPKPKRDIIDIPTFEPIDDSNDDTSVPHTLSIGPEEPITPNNDGSNLKLHIKWVLWIHPNESKDWSSSSYDKLMDITNVSQFWALMNNFDKLDYRKNQFYIMRNNVAPTWEDSYNRNGSTISYRYDISQKICIDFWIDVCILTLNEMISPNMGDITGVSFGSKNNWAMIKIWNMNGNIDISKNISSILTKKYPNQTPLHKKNTPEY